MAFNSVELTINRRTNEEMPSDIYLSTGNVRDADGNYLLSAIDFVAFFTETDRDVNITVIRLSEGESSALIEANSSVIAAAESFLEAVLS